MRRVVFITGHHILSRRKAGFHFLARAFHRASWDVLFFTAALSPLSWLRGDYRTRIDGLRPNRIVPVCERLSGFAWVTPFHPVNLRGERANRLAAPLFRRYGDLPLGEAEAWFRSADLVVFESFAGMLLFDRVRRINPSARLVYRVSDDMRWLKLHPVCLEAEAAAAPRFDLVSAPNATIHRRFAHLPNAVVQFHGIDKTLFERACPNPYAARSDGRRNAVFCGVANLDVLALSAVANRFTDWCFHVIGPFPGLPRLENVIGYGEMAMEETVGFIKYADVGLNTLVRRPHAEVLTDTLKLRQYTYCRLPVLAPDYVDFSDKPHVMTYRADEPDTAVEAFARAASFDRSTIAADRIPAWDELVPTLAGD